ncbi:class I SAM-dependent methyltransferase [Hymenobacter volaticus]|uniref:Class I SAM-dependent methyltransferase n=1 Tax=Hymenobacter volaticus TaxID=2932254 RepID=A0ABY4GEI9_9BACT|nr:class I SAM-dependent methyltransferase [Hymenobacter volaticus]UOQ69221.1 class I SAM-dependent methyltransferase [Hymenobacter volaticus]
MIPLAFKDNFSRQAALYAQFRPVYSPELYAYLASLTLAHELAWDCGTGNGQAALSLAQFYARVVATDPSPQQLSHCRPHERVSYRVEQAEHTDLAAHSADLVTAATALHWFHFEAFYAEVRRVLKPGGVLAAWAYGVPTLTPAVDAVVRRLHDVTLDPYWQPENRLIDSGYATIPFPFQHIPSPVFSYEKPLNRLDLLGYLNTWSATQRFLSAEGYNPTEQVAQELQVIWPDAATQHVATWKLVLKVGRVSDAR